MLWKRIIGYEDSYEINNKGEICSLERYVNNKNGKRLIKSKLLKPFLTNSGYIGYTLKNKNKSKSVHLHRLLAEYFIDNPNNLPEVNHIDGDKLNNKLSNLEWVNKSENSLHAYKLGLKKSNFKPTEKGEDNPNSKLTQVIVNKIRELYSSGNYSQRDLGKKFNVKQATIW